MTMLYIELLSEHMNYADGRKINVGDLVKYPDNSSGSVVFSIDDGVYSPGYPKEQWEYLKTGIMIKSESFGLTHYAESIDTDIEFLSHAKII